MSRLYSGTYLCRERSVVLFKALDGSSSHIRTGQRWRHRNRLHSTLTDAASTRSNKIVDTFQSEPAEPTLPPLAALPFSVLLRSLLVSTISSSPYLLQPSLLALSFLSKPHRGFLFDVKRNPLLYWPLKWTFYRQFCAGENVAECQKTMNSMRSMGFEGTLLTYAKETVFDHKDGTEQAFGTKESSTSDVNETCEAIKAWKDGTLETVNMLGEGDQLAVKYVCRTHLQLDLREKQRTDKNFSLSPTGSLAQARRQRKHSRQVTCPRAKCSTLSTRFAVLLAIAGRGSWSTPSPSTSSPASPKQPST